MKILKTSSLFFKEGSSDKVYEVDLVEENGMFSVNFRFGKRNTKLQTGTKTSNPVDLKKAEVIFDKLIKEKTAKGYTFDENGIPFTSDQHERTDYLPQLLNVIEESEVEGFLNNDSFVGQPKIDGIRLVVQIENQVVKAFNRNGLLVAKLPKVIEEELANFELNCVFDGELVKETFFVFDVLSKDGDTRYLSYRKRLEHLEMLFSSKNTKHVILVKTAYTKNDKKVLFDHLKSSNEEGIVFKNLDAPYTAGRPNSKGDQLKFKFVTTVSVIVTGINEQRSVSIALIDNDQTVSVGNVKIPTNASIPELNAILEVQYLYAFRETNALFQPVYLGVRTDIGVENCSIDQLKYKSQDIHAKHIDAEETPINHKDFLILTKFRDIFEKQLSKNEYLEIKEFYRLAALKLITKQEVDEFLRKVDTSVFNLPVISIRKFLPMLDFMIGNGNNREKHELSIQEEKKELNPTKLNLLLLPIIAKYRNMIFNESHSIYELFSCDRALIDDVIAEINGDKRIINIINSYGIFMIHFEDGRLVYWTNQVKHSLENVVRILSDDYILCSDKYMYTLNRDDIFDKIPDYPNIEEIWPKSLYKYSKPEFYYKDAVTKKLINVNCPIKSVFDGSVNPKKIGLNYQGVEWVLYYNGILKYIKNDRVNELRNVYDVSSISDYYAGISFNDGRLEFRGQQYQFESPVTFSKDSYLKLSSTKTTYCWNNDNSFRKFSDNDIFFFLSDGFIEYFKGNARLYDKNGDMIFDSSNSIQHFQNIKYNYDSIYWTLDDYSVQNIGESLNYRVKQNTPFWRHDKKTILYTIRSYIFESNYFIAIDVYDKCLIAIKSDWYRSFKYQEPNTFDKYKEIQENVSKVVVAQNFIVILYLDGHIECIYDHGEYKSISKVKNLGTVLNIESINNEIYLLNSIGEVWTYNKQKKWYKFIQDKAVSLNYSLNKCEIIYIKDPLLDELNVIDPVLTEAKMEIYSKNDTSVIQIAIPGYKDPNSVYISERAEIPLDLLVNPNQNEKLNLKWVHTGLRHNVFILKNGSILGNGLNNFGCLNLDTWENVEKAFALTGATIGLSNNKILVACSNKNKVPWIDVPSRENVTDIAGAFETVAVVYSDGSSYKYESDHWIKISDSGLKLQYVKDKILLLERKIEVNSELDTNKRTKLEKSISPDVLLNKKKNKKQLEIDKYEEKVRRINEYKSNPYRDKVSFGSEHFAVIMNDGSVVAVGLNKYGECDTEEWRDIVRVECGNDFTYGTNTKNETVYSGIERYYSIAGITQNYDRRKNFNKGTIYSKPTSKLTVENYQEMPKKSRDILDYTSQHRMVKSQYSERMSLEKNRYFLNVDGKLLDANNNVIEEGIQSVGNEDCYVKNNQLYILENEVEKQIYDDIPLAYGRLNFGIVYLDKDENVNIYFNSGESDKYFNLNEFGAIELNKIKNEYEEYSKYMYEHDLLSASKVFDYSLDRQISTYGTGYIAIDENKGLITNQDGLNPILKDITKPVKQIVTYNNDVAVLFDDGTVYSTRKSYQLSNLKSIIGIRISKSNLLCISDIGTISIFGNNIENQDLIINRFGIIDAILGDDYIVALDSYGKISSVGNFEIKYKFLGCNDGPLTTWNNDFKKDIEGNIEFPDAIALYMYKKTLIVLNRFGYLTLLNNTLSADLRDEVQMIANVISVNTIDGFTIINNSGAALSLKNKFVPEYLIDTKVLCILKLADQQVLKTIDGKVEVI